MLKAMQNIARVFSSWLQRQPRSWRAFFWIVRVVVAFALVRLVFGHSALGSFFGTLTVLGSVTLACFGFVLLIQRLYRRVLWKVRNRLVLTYLLMGLAPVVLFGTLTGIAGYIFAGQFSISAVLAKLDEAADQIKGEGSALAALAALGDIQLHEQTLNFDQETNTREGDIAVALLHDGTWSTIPLRTPHGVAPNSPFDHTTIPPWLHAGFHGVVTWHGRLYLCRVAWSNEEKRSAEVLTTLELNQRSLSSVGQSLGRILLFSGSASEHRQEIDNAEREAQNAEREADLAETQRQAQEELAEAQRQRQEGMREASEQMREAQREVGRAQEEVTRARGAHDGAPEDQDEAQSDLKDAQEQLHDVESQVQEAASTPAIPTTPAPPSRPPKRLAQGRNGTGIPETRTGTNTPSSGSSSAPGTASDEGFTAVSGGTLPAGRWIDPRVYFTSPFPVTTWSDGQQHSALLVVISRPSALYGRLFSNSVEMGSLFRNVLIAIAIGFGVIELLALWMASRLSSTITRSVSDLYEGTTEIDRGNLSFRVRPHRQDQLGALAGSFNRMAGSIEDLLVQQRERDRLLNELAIAQEVQQNLFPQSPVVVSGLEMHAVCLPARSVSGDYFDFIFGHNTLGKGTGACIALGDISGKGISAALLMATLHSAVRAFSLREGTGMPSPSQQLELLNQHLFGSTQANRYATLFLAFYDAQTRRLTYSNGGHLPPFLISVDGTMRRLDVGGAVVGLLEGMRYEEATVELRPGDLLAAFTDGVTEPEDREGQEFGDDRLLRLLEQDRNCSLPEIADTLFAQLQGWIAGQEQPDDMTLLLARQR